MAPPQPTGRWRGGQGSRCHACAVRAAGWGRRSAAAAGLVAVGRQLECRPVSRPVSRLLLPAAAAHVQPDVVTRYKAVAKITNGAPALVLEEGP